MITEEQRRALFALREALRLCEQARIYVSPQDDYDGYRCVLEVGGHDSFGQLTVADIDAVLQEHPE